MSQAFEWIRLGGPTMLLLVALLYNNTTRSGRYPKYW